MHISNAIDFTQKVSVTGVVVAIGHSAAEAALIDKAIEAGARDHSLEKRQSQKRGATADSFSRPKITKNGSYQASFNLMFNDIRIPRDLDMDHVITVIL
jgi:hypothetical protein